MKLHLDALSDRAGWEAAGFELPRFDVHAVKENTRKAPAGCILAAASFSVRSLPPCFSSCSTTATAIRAW